MTRTCSSVSVMRSKSALVHGSPHFGVWQQVRALQPDGGVLHVHENVREDQIDKWTAMLTTKLLRYAEVCQMRIRTHWTSDASLYEMFLVSSQDPHLSVSVWKMN